MNFENYDRAFRHLQIAKTYAYAISIGLAIALILSLMKLLTIKPIITVIPSTFKEEITIGENHATNEFYSVWGHFIAATVGNVTPSNGAFIIDQISPLLDSRIYQDAMDLMNNQILSMQMDRVSYSFEVTKVSFEAGKQNPVVVGKEVISDPLFSNDTVYVTGNQLQHAPLGDPIRRQMTYEMVLKVVDYAPRIMALSYYEGAPQNTKISRRLKEREFQAGEKGAK